MPDSIARQPPNCARRRPQRVLRTSWPPAHHELMPRGAVAVRLCSYSGLGSSYAKFPELSLIRSRLVDTAGSVAGLSRDFNALPPVSERFVCPLDDGSEIVALIAYPNGRSLTITIRRTGCKHVTNGAMVRSGFVAAYNPAARQLADELDRLLK